MRNLRPLLLTGAALVVAITTLASTPTMASEPAKPRACRWDKQTGRMICQRTAPPKAPAPDADPQKPGTS